MLPILYILVYYFVVVCSLPVPTPFAEVADRKIHYAHKYHGIDFSTMDEFGNGWFERGGKKCKLFTNSFEIWYEGKKVVGNEH
jgi:hypothetical protein